MEPDYLIILQFLCWFQIFKTAMGPNLYTNPLACSLRALTAEFLARACSVLCPFIKYKRERGVPGAWEFPKRSKPGKERPQQIHQRFQNTEKGSCVFTKCYGGKWHSGRNLREMVLEVLEENGIVVIIIPKTLEIEVLEL